MTRTLKMPINISKTPERFPRSGVCRGSYICIHFGSLLLYLPEQTNKIGNIGIVIAVHFPFFSQLLRKLQHKSKTDLPPPMHQLSGVATH